MISKPVFYYYITFLVNCYEKIISFVKPHVRWDALRINLFSVHVNILSPKDE